MGNLKKSDDGKYHIQGKVYDVLVGSRAQVWHSTAYKTTGGLTKNKLMKNKHGRVVSKKKHATAKKEKRLVKSGYKPKKGVFGIAHVKKTSKKRTRKSKK